jgi:predicted HAD superfamily phosphohydrolase YqeG
MFTYVRMKRKEYRVKLAVYTAIDKIIKEQEGITKLVTDLYNTLKDVPTDELQTKFITALAEIAKDKANG